MTEKRPGGSGRKPTLQDELLADLRRVSPALAPAPASANRSVAAGRVGRDTPTVIVEWTPLRWSRPRAGVGHGEATLSAGPMRISVRGFGR